MRFQQRQQSCSNGYTRSIQLRVLAAVIAFLVTVSTPLLALAATCTRPQKTLTSQCNKLCETFHPCVIIDDALDRDWTCGSEPLSGLSTCVARIVDPCHYECFAVDKTRPVEYTTFSFFVPFGAWRSKYEREQASNAIWTQQVAALNATSLNASVSWKRNDNVQAIEWLELPSTCTDVVLVGGTTEQSVKGKAASVNIAADMLTNNTFITTVRLVNLDLESNAAIVAAMLPASQLTTLTLANALLETMPVNLKRLKSLLSLDLQSNYIASVGAADAIDGLLHLNLHNNNVSSFSAAMPKLQTLNLSANALTEIPSAVFQMTQLTTLALDANPLALTISVSQLAFLTKLETLVLPASSTPLACDASKQKQLGGTSVCVVDDAALKKVSSPSGSDAPPAAASSSASSSSSSSPAALIGGIAGAVVVLALIAYAVVVARRKRSTGTKSSKDPSSDQYASDATPTSDSKQQQQQRTADSASSNHHHSLSSTAAASSTAATTFLSVWNDPELLSIQLNVDDIEDVKPIGSGAYGVVWLVRYRQSQLLASKRLKPGEADRARTQDFISELKLVAKLEHPNIVRFIGAAWTVESDVQGLFEFMNGGDLKTYLLERDTPRHWTQEKVAIAIGIAEALVYVHSFMPPLVHRDLKSRNVLLTDALDAKLTDFGVSRFRSEDNTMTAGVGTAKWLAPEVIAGAGDYGPPADVYAFGVVLSEIDTHDTPFADARSATGNPLPEIAVLQMVARGELTPSFSVACPATIKELALRCLVFEPADRPSAVELAYQLRTIQRNLYASL